MNGVILMDTLHSAPLLAMLLLLAVLFIGDLFTRRKNTKSLLWITSTGLALIAAGTLAFITQLHQAAPLWGGLMRMDYASLSMIVLISLGGAITAALATNDAWLVEHGEFSLLLVAATFGLALMAVSVDLILLYLALEMAAIPLYVLAGFLIHDRLSTEAGLKYLLYGAAASAVMLYGMSWLYGLSGYTHFSDIALMIQSGEIAPLPLITAIVLVMVGFAYKIAAVPFHFWAPDVYQGAPAQISGFLATVSKTAGFVVLLRFLVIFTPLLLPQMRMLVAGMAVLSMLAGNLLAMQQSNIKRLLAYSSIAHAGYLLLGVATGTAISTAAVFYYLTGYLFTNIAAFALADLASKGSHSQEIESFSGLNRRNPGLALMFLVVFLSLAGIPPFAGFAGKFFVFYAAAQAGLNWLVVIGVLNSVMALFYYLNVLKVIYARPQDKLTDFSPIVFSTTVKVALGVCLAAILYFGVAYLPWYDLLHRAATMLWN